MIIKPAKRTESVQEYYFSRKLKEIAQMNAARKAAGEELVINLGIGSPDGMPPMAAIDALVESASQPGNHAYQSYAGLPEFRQAFASWYKKWYGVELSEENKKQFLIPKGFAHGFLVLTDTAEFCYKCDDFYHANDEGGLAWNDPEIGIQWPEVIGNYNGSASAEGYTLSDGTKLNLSEKDQKWLGIQQTFRF